MRYICIWLIRLYRKYLSPLKGHPTCRFIPSCSAYAEKAYRKRGFFIGSMLTAWRILRCNPLFNGGYDPVPEHGFSNREQREKYARTLDSAYDGYEDEAFYSENDRK